MGMDGARAKESVPRVRRTMLHWTTRRSRRRGERWKCWERRELRRGIRKNMIVNFMMVRIERRNVAWKWRGMC